jgi:hypothetical protein
VSEEWPPRVLDPDGREVVFDGGAHLHLAGRKRADLLDRVSAVLGTVARPDQREVDPIPGRERFYREGFDGPQAWLLVVVDFTEAPAWIVTAFVTHRDPRGRHP